MKENLLDNLKEINEAQQILNQLLDLLPQAEKHFRSARNWGIADIFSDGMMIDLFKHSALNKASNVMNRINSLLHDLQRELKDIYIPVDFEMNLGGFSTFADFIFDGFLVDMYMQSKIVNSLNQVEELHRRLIELNNQLNRLKSRY